MRAVVDPKAVCDSPHIGNGTRIWGFSHILSNAKVGEFCKIGEHVFIENQVTIGNRCTIKNGVALWDGVTLEDDVFVGPYAVFTNDIRPRAFIKLAERNFRKTLVKRGSTIGANSVILCGVTLGEFSFVGAGSVVTTDVPPHTLVVGNPAKAIGRVCFCGDTLTELSVCPSCKLPLQENSYERVLSQQK